MKIGGLIIATIIFVLIDLYTFKGLKLLTSGLSNPTIRTVIHYAYWVINIALLVGLFIMINSGSAFSDPKNYKYFFYMFGLLILFTVPKLVFIVFHGLEDLWHLGTNLFQKISPPKDAVAESMFDGEVIGRRKFLTKVGLIAAAIPFTSIAYGMLKGRYDFRVLRESLSFPNLPSSFHGLKIVHISDIHIGSFFDNHEAVEKGITMVNELEPDIIFFTGDLVNNYASEMHGWVPVLSKLKARIGKYSILGNHDYGDYGDFPSVLAKEENLQELKDYHHKIGFKLLLNNAEHLNINGEEIAIIGVENWGKPPFKQYGNLTTAMNGTAHQPFKILLSHDPSHWEEEVMGKQNIDLTLSGHTHGMQFGVEIGSIKWSPVKMKYKRWGGLYKEGKQHLYVNRGFGYIGFPGRVGMPPEITLLEINQA